MTQDNALRVPLGRSNRVALIDPADAVVAVQYRWYRNSNGYAVTFLDDPPNASGSRYQVGMHRVLMGLERDDGLEVDHINLDRLDNRRANLRVVTGPQNDQNRPRGYGKYSQYRGVTWNKDRWRAYITVDDRQISLGRYDEELEAALAAEAARRAHMPFAMPIIELEPREPCPCKDCSPGRLPGRFKKA